jgi:broad specificity polyphosphatase/5'/3'-nucleotidase SurE
MQQQENRPNPLILIMQNLAKDYHHNQHFHICGETNQEEEIHQEEEAHQEEFCVLMLEEEEIQQEETHQEEAIQETTIQTTQMQINDQDENV